MEEYVGNADTSQIFDAGSFRMDTVLDTAYAPVAVPDIPAHVPGFLMTLRNILTEQECADIIQIAEEQGFVRASLYTDFTGKEHFSDIRKSSRCIMDSPEFVARLWKRIKNYVPTKWGSADCVGLNERLRILRYDTVGDEFKPHSDGSYTAPNGAISRITVLIYLNVGYTGAYTNFLHENGTDWIPIEPHVGSVAMQDQALSHCVPPLQSGCKYAIRTEVMYKFPVVHYPNNEKVIVITEE